MGVCTNARRTRHSTGSLHACEAEGPQHAAHGERRRVQGDQLVMWGCTAWHARRCGGARAACASRVGVKPRSRTAPSPACVAAASTGDVTVQRAKRQRHTMRCLPQQQAPGPPGACLSGASSRGRTGQTGEGLNAPWLSGTARARHGGAAAPTACPLGGSRSAGAPGLYTGGRAGKGVWGAVHEGG